MCRKAGCLASDKKASPCRGETILEPEKDSAKRPAKGKQRNAAGPRIQYHENGQDEPGSRHQHHRTALWRCGLSCQICCLYRHVKIRK
jgi:hypothetical protein